MNKFLYLLFGLILGGLVVFAGLNYLDEDEQVAEDVEKETEIEDEAVDENEEVENVERQKVKKTVEIADQYVNTKYGFKFDVPEGGEVKTDITMSPQKPESAEYIAIVFAENNDPFYVTLDVMANAGTFPEIKESENLSAKAFVQKWWEENKYDTNPNTTITISQVFEKEINGTSWFGFTLDGAMVFSNGSGGQILEKPRTVMVAKNGDIFYRWQFNSSFETDVEELLNTFEFTN